MILLHTPSNFSALHNGEPVRPILTDEASTIAGELVFLAQGPEMRFVAANELGRYRMWIQNCPSLLPYLKFPR